MYSFSKALVTSALLFIVGCHASQPSSSKPQEAWDRVNDPLNLGKGWERGFDKLPTQGEISKTPWSDSYWPSYMAGIAQRWQQGDDVDNFAYGTPKRKQVLRMSQEELSQLSPAEKFDIINGNFSYPTVKLERSRTAPDNPQWFGICHGWAPAAVAFDEPQPITVESVDGSISVPFGSSDIKALLSYYVGQVAHSRSHLLGGRCNETLESNPEAARLPECRDVNAGAFHVVLTNMIALRDTGFVADVTRDSEVWNQPIHGFSTRVVSSQEPSEGAAPGTVREVLVETVMNYTVEIDPTADAVVGTDQQANKAKTYSYRVELNAQGEIIGGEWLSDDRPDFLWTQDKPEFNVEGWDALGEIYQNSRQAESAE